MSDRLPTRLWRALSQAWRGDPLPARGYAAAAPHRLLADWPGTAQSANKSTRYQSKALRFRARELRENSGLVARYAQLCRDNIVGPDGVTVQTIVPSSRGSNAAAAAAIERAWYRWSDACTPDGRPWKDVCDTLAESWRVEGEALLELIPSPRAPMGLWVQPLDADLLDEKKNQDVTATGGTIVQGIEYDAAGRIVRYHLLTKHPSDGEVARYRQVPADRLLYLPHRSRPQQARGVTPLAPVMVLIQHLDKTDEAVVVLNRITASKMGAMIPGENAQPIDGTDGAPPMVEQAPGEWWVMPQGWDIKMLDPGQPTQEYDVFAKHVLRKLASGLGVSYASLTGDVSDVNYSSIRAGMIAERDAWQALQAAFIAAVVQPTYAFWLRTAFLSGAIALPNGQTPQSVADASRWHPRRWAWVDPLKDAQGIELLLSMGLTTRTREAAKQGLAFDELLAERTLEEAAIKASGVTLGTSAATSASPDDSTDDSTDDGEDDQTPPSAQPLRVA